MPATTAEINAGQAVYTPRSLKVYDFVVLGVSNRLLWRCPTQRILDLYNREVTDNHLDVGVGSGWYPDHCRFPSAAPRLALMDLNADALAFTAQRVARYQPETWQCNVLAPIEQQIAPFDSIALNYLLHCLPGSLAEKAVVFDHVGALVKPGGRIFGSTLLQGDAPRSLPARGLMGLYNRKGIFTNTEDDLATLHQALESRFEDVQIDMVGCAALFSAGQPL